MARNVMEQLLKDGTMKRGYLGVFIQTLTPELTKEFDLPDTSGALVSGVSSDTPAGQAGIKEGDVITEFNGKKVEDSRSLRLMVSQTAPDTKAALKVIRDGKPKNFTVTLGELPKDQASLGAEKPGAARDLDALDGVEVGDLDGAARRQFEIPSNIRGALVLNVEEGSNAAEAGLRQGDVILEIERQPVRDADSAVELASKARGERLLLRVWSQAGDQNGTRYLTVDNTKRKR
jgi:serine protease Do